MTHLPSALLLFVAFTVMASGCGSNDADGADDDDGATDAVALGSDLEAALAELADAGSVPGFAYAVVDADGIVETAGYGYANLERGVEARPETLFHIGSTHKAMNALLAATLVEDGTLRWDTALADLAVDFDIEPNITVEQLLTMTSGVPADAEDDLAEDPGDPEDWGSVIFDQFDEARLLDTPGSVFDYSNISASAAGYAAVLAVDPDETDLHQGYLELFTERVLEPLGMSDSTLLASEAQATGRLAASYELDAEGVRVLESEDDDADLLAPSGSLKSTVVDMARFLQMLVADGVTADGSRIVTPETIATMFEPALENYAMGWEQAASGDYLVHEGAFDGFASVIVIAPDDQMAMVLLTNSERAAVDLVTAAPELFFASISG